MSVLTVFSLAQSAQWDAVVRSFREYDVYWLSGYVRAFQLHGDGEPLLFFYEDAGVRGINVVMRRDVADDPHFRGTLEKGRYFDLSTPYGYGGWIIEGENAAPLFCAYEAWLKRHAIISEFARFHPMLQNHTRCAAFYDVLPLGEVVHMELSSPEDIWENLTSKNRNMIRKAEKNGIRIFNGRFPEIYETFREIYNDTMDKDRAHAYYYFGEAFYASLLNDLPENAQVFWAQKDKTVIAASVLLAANGRMNYHLSGSRREYGSLAPTNLLLYRAALWGCANGCKTLFLGGGVGSGEDSLFRFKRAFYRGELNRFHIGRSVYDPETYGSLVRMRNVSESGFFPLYRCPAKANG